MEAIILAGLPAAGKTTFACERLADTHVRISLDVLGTRPREAALVRECIARGRPFVIDSTNPTAADRARYARQAKVAGYRIVCYYFATTTRASLARNIRRAPEQRVPAVAIFRVQKLLRPPSTTEGFDAILVVRLAAGGFVVEPLVAGA